MRLGRKTSKPYRQLRSYPRCLSLPLFGDHFSFRKKFNSVLKCSTETGPKRGRHCFCMKSQCVHCFKIFFSSYASLSKQFTASQGWQMLQCNQHGGSKIEEWKGKKPRNPSLLDHQWEWNLVFSSREFPIIPRDTLILRFLGWGCWEELRGKGTRMNIFWVPDGNLVALSPLPYNRRHFSNEDTDALGGYGTSQRSHRCVMSCPARLFLPLSSLLLQCSGGLAVPSVVWGPVALALLRSLLNWRILSPIPDLRNQICILTRSSRICMHVMVWEALLPHLEEEGLAVNTVQSSQASRLESADSTWAFGPWEGRILLESSGINTLRCTGQLLTMKNYPPQNVQSADVEIPQARCLRLEFTSCSCVSVASDARSSLASVS